MDWANSSPLEGGVYVMALAPAWMVSRMVSSVGPPVAMMGTSGNLSRMERTMAGVLPAPDTLSISAPASIRARTSVLSDTTVTTTGISSTCLSLCTTSLLVGALTTTPKAPSCSASLARLTTRRPRVTPPPTPVNTGISAACITARWMAGWGG